MPTLDDRKGSRWQIVRTEEELRRTPLVRSLLTHREDALLADDPILKRARQCRDGAVNAPMHDQPVALLVSETDQLLQIAFPSTGLVSRHWRDEDGSLRFSVDGSPAVFTLPADRNDLAGIVLHASDSDGGLLVLDPSFVARPIIVEALELPDAPRNTFDLDPADISALSRDAANDLYAQVFAHDSVRPYATGIPFRLSYSHCETKAQAVADLLRGTGITVGKVWIQATGREVLRISTTSRRECVEQWDFHVAVLVRADPEQPHRFWVFDPTTSLEAGVLSLDEWQSRFTGGGRFLRFTTSDAYRRRGAGFTAAATPGETLEALVIARCVLAAIAEEHGHPPFECGIGG